MSIKIPSSGGKFERGGAIEFAIIADDLTGAMDSGVQLAAAGHRTAVIFHGPHTLDLDTLDAVSFDTDSRALATDEARERVIWAGERLRDARIVYKKIDSTLRGNIAVEIEAALDATGRGRAIVAPAFPANGRTTEGGIQLLRGVPVHETEFAKDPRTPVRQSRIPALLSDIGPVAAIGVGETGSLRRTMESHRVVVADASDESRLEAVARGVPNPSEVLWVGSAGLALALGRVYPGTHAEERASSGDAPHRRILIVVGSRSEVSAGQCERLAAEPGVEEIVFREDGAEDALGRARDIFEAGRSVLLRCAAEEGSPDAIVDGLAGVAASLAEEEVFEALVLTGGETAVNVVRRLGGEGVFIEREVEAGVPVGVVIGHRPYRVVTKAGAFGGPDTLAGAFRYLAGTGKGGE
ncbi:MAG: four-carbon acid sugar kinase family protein [Rubrobacter sp.]|nr:four-carbon acid sugar kinase family protein [Rubrobacter sp.]